MTFDLEWISVNKALPEGMFTLEYLEKVAGFPKEGGTTIGMDEPSVLEVLK